MAKCHLCKQLLTTMKLDNLDLRRCSAWFGWPLAYILDAKSSTLIPHPSLCNLTLHQPPPNRRLIHHLPHLPPTPPLHCPAPHTLRFHN